MTRARRSAVAVVGGIALGVMGMAACAPSGGTVRVDSEFIFTWVAFTAAPGRANDVTFTSDGDDVIVHDAGDTLRASDGCTSVDANTARCALPDMFRSVTMDLRDGDDTGTNASSVGSKTTVEDSSGAEVGGLDGGPGDDVLTGGSLGDLLTGDEGEDDLDGGGGDDLLREGSSAAATEELDVDTFAGGPGADTVDYVFATSAVSVTLRGDADDGRPGEGDLVGADIERAFGGSGPDHLLGNAGTNLLDGGPANDVIIGGRGADELRGSFGNDLLSEAPAAIPFDVDFLDADIYRGGPGVDRVLWDGGLGGVTVDLDDVADDGRATEGDNVMSDVERINGGNGADSLTGDGDANILVGNGAADDIDGGAGDDILLGSAGFDALDGGTQTDDCEVGADGGTRVNCEF